VGEREGRLTVADAKAQQFNEHLEKLQMFLQMAEDKVGGLKKDDLDLKDIEQGLKELQVSGKEVAMFKCFMITQDGSVSV
jgi:hypothetical protein